MLSDRIAALSAAYTAGLDLSLEEVGELLDYIVQQSKNIDRLNGAVAALNQQNKELNATSQALAQQIKNMDAGYQRNAARFNTIAKFAQNIITTAKITNNRLRLLDRERLNRIVKLAKMGETEEGDDATV